MKHRLGGIALFAIATFLGLTVVGRVGMVPAPAATLAVPSPTPSPVLSTGPASNAASGLSMDSPVTRKAVFDLNSVGASVALSHLDQKKQPTCQVSVYGTFSSSLAVTTASSFANLQNGSNIVAWITAPGVYTVPIGVGNTMLQVDTLVYNSGDPMVVPDCTGGTFLVAGTLPAAPSPTPTLPPQGVYNSCLIDAGVGLSACEAIDATISGDGFAGQINYNGLSATRAHLQAQLTYDATLSPVFSQYFSVASMLEDTSIGPGCSGTCNKLITVVAGPLATDCNVTTDYALLECLATALPHSTYPNYGLYLYDEPGCPNQSIGYCQGFLGSGNYANVPALAALVSSLFTNVPVFGVNTPSGVPATGGWAGANGQTQISNIYSCNAQAPCASPTSPTTPYPWLVGSAQPTTGWDYYPYFCYPGGTCGSGQLPSDEQYISAYLGNVIAANNPGQRYVAVLQAFSGFQESGAGCSSITLCSFPTTTQMQAMRDNALSGYHPAMIFWYYWPDVTCLNTYTGCNSATNQAALRAAAFAPYPSAP